jgi:hypothetical protein
MIESHYGNVYIGLKKEENFAIFFNPIFFVRIFSEVSREGQCFTCLKSRERITKSSIKNGGYSYIVVQDGNYLNKGELYLYLQHCFEDTELDLQYLEKVMPHMNKLWGRAVHL